MYVTDREASKQNECRQSNSTDVLTRVKNGWLVGWLVGDIGDVSDGQNDTPTEIEKK